MSAQSGERNAFLARLSLSEFALLRPHLASFEMRIDDRLHHAGKDVENVIFPRSGLIILSIPMRDGPGAGILVGRDDVVGGQAAAAAAPATSDADVCIGGQALRISATSFRYVLEQSPAIRQLAARFDIAMMKLAQQTALCNAAHPVEGRVCRLALEADDCNQLDRVPLTQATVGRMLGVRRTTITLIAQRLEAAGLINCRRGYVQIVNRDELERHACECYAELKQSRAHLFAAPETVGKPLSPLPESASGRAV